MVRCPECKKELESPKKTWNYAQFSVQSFKCSNCGSDFRDYSRDGEYAFTLIKRRAQVYYKKIDRHAK